MPKRIVKKETEIKKRQGTGVLDRPPSEFSRSADKCNSKAAPRTFNYYSGLSFLQYLGSLPSAPSKGHRCRECNPPRYYEFRKGLLEHRRMHHPPAHWDEKDVKAFRASGTVPSPQPLKPFIKKDKRLPKHRSRGRPPKARRAPKAALPRTQI